MFHYGFARLAIYSKMRLMLPPPAGPVFAADELMLHTDTPIPAFAAAPAGSLIEYALFLAAAEDFIEASA